MSSSHRIIFMGTPEYAVPFLEALIQSGLKPTAVITQPNKPSGRSAVPADSAVKKTSEMHGIRVLQPADVNSRESIAEIRALQPDLIIVVAFGQIISKEILELPSFGCINVHPSLLPKYRGPSPRQAPILNGDTETGVTIMMMDEKMDHGPILAQKTISLENRETCESLSAKTITIGVPLLVATIRAWFQKTIYSREQDHTQATFTKLLKKDSGRIDWSQQAVTIDRTIRALNPWPGTWTEWRGKRLKILEAAPASIPEQQIKTADMLFAHDKLLFALCGDQTYLEILKLQVEGKNAVTSTAFINGYLHR